MRRISSFSTRLALSAISLFAVLLVAHADTDNINNITVKFKPNCDAPVQNLNLGNLSISVTAGTGGNAGRTVMRAAFDMSAGAQSSHICDCVKLHFIQYIYQDSCPASYNGVPVPGDQRIIDPPKGGWDYMYKKNAMGQHDRSLGIDPAWVNYADDDPWYYSATGEASGTASDGSKFVDPCKKYIIEDAPGLCPAPGTTKFITYLAAESLNRCDDPICLKPGEILLLAGFGWTSKASPTIDSLLHVPQQGGADAVNDAMRNAGFTGRTAVVDKALCCPEPGSIAAMVIGIAALARRRYRQAR